MRNVAYLSLLLLFFACTGCNTDIVTGEDPDDLIGMDGTDGQDGADNQNGQNGNDEQTEADLALASVNALRAAGCTCGNTRMPPVPALTLSPELNAASRAHAEDQLAMNSMTHRGSDGSRVGDRATRFGYVWSAVGENVAQGYPSVEAVIDGWARSEGHCRNMMSANFQHMGFGSAKLFYAQAFGRPR